MGSLIRYPQLRPNSWFFEYSVHDNLASKFDPVYLLMAGFYSHISATHKGLQLWARIDPSNRNPLLFKLLIIDDMPAMDFLISILCIVFGLAVFFYFVCDALIKANFKLGELDHGEIRMVITIAFTAIYIV